MRPGTVFLTITKACAALLALSFALNTSANTVNTITNAPKNAYQSIPELKETILKFVNTQLGPAPSGQWQVEVGFLDPRVQLALCKPEFLNLFVPNQNTVEQTTTIGVRCQDPVTPWSMYAPVKINRLDYALVAARPLASKQLIQSGDVQVTLIDVNRFSGGYLRDPNQVVHKLTKQPLSMGQPILVNQVITPSMIKRGETVTIMVNQHGINVAMPGVALQEGALGERIQVKNIRSKRIVEGEVVGVKQVQIALPKQINAKVSASSSDNTVKLAQE